MTSEIDQDGHQAGINPAPQESAELGQPCWSSDEPWRLVRGFSTKGAAEYLGVSESYLKSARKKKKPKRIVGPKFTRLGKKCIYLREDLDAHLNEAKQAFYSD